jgi:hypothetical protein
MQRGKMMNKEGLDARAFEDDGALSGFKEGLDARAFEDDKENYTPVKKVHFKEGLDARAFDDNGGSASTFYEGFDENEPFFKPMPVEKSTFNTSKIMNNINELYGKFVNPKDFWAQSIGSTPTVNDS